MIVSVNPKPSFDEFSLLMHATDALLNDDALKRPQYYTGRSGNPLEDVFGGGDLSQLVVARILAQCLSKHLGFLLGHLFGFYNGCVLFAEA